MRITSGIARGIVLKSPKGDATRPATDAARQAVFSSLAHEVAGARVLDLFAGTGSYGLEALSRGAKSAVFVEKNRGAYACLSDNISSVKKCAPEIEARAVLADCFSLSPEKLGGSFDMIFADAPYPLLQKNPEEIFGIFARLASDSTIVVLEAPADFEPPQNSRFDILKRLGKNSKGKPSQLVMQKSAGETNK
ncbi:MAG: RsmD family RNA methyltransferase [Opitutales bacterium]|nr:RsmD family RNA methyltransferase [Opitutales bacterium]